MLLHRFFHKPNSKIKDSKFKFVLVAQCSCVRFLEESRFSLYREDGRLCVWHHVSKWFSDAIVLPTVVVQLWFGQAYGMDNEHSCISWMACWMHRDTVMRSWGPIHPRPELSVTSLYCTLHVARTCTFLHDQHTQQTCHPWCSEYNNRFKFLSITYQLPRGVNQHSTGHNQQSKQLFKKMFCTARDKWCSHQILYITYNVKPHICVRPFIVACSRYICS